MTTKLAKTVKRRTQSIILREHFNHDVKTTYPLPTPLGIVLLSLPIAVHESWYNATAELNISHCHLTTPNSPTEDELTRGSRIPKMSCLSMWLRSMCIGPLRIWLYDDSDHISTATHNGPHLPRDQAIWGCGKLHGETFMSSEHEVNYP
jgi:hypothetical protein